MTRTRTKDRLELIRLHLMLVQREGADRKAEAAGPDEVLVTPTIAEADRACVVALEAVRSWVTCRAHPEDDTGDEWLADAERELEAAAQLLWGYSRPEAW